MPPKDNDFKCSRILELTHQHAKQYNKQLEEPIITRITRDLATNKIELILIKINSWLVKY